MLNVFFYDINGDEKPKLKLKQSYFPTLQKCQNVSNDELTANESFSFPALTSLSSIFRYNENLENVTLDVPNVTTQGNSFYGCPNLKTININAPNLTTASYTFEGCESLLSGNFYCPKLNTQQGMFSGCGMELVSNSSSNNFGGVLDDLNTIIITTDNLEDGTNMFYYSPNLVGVCCNLNKLKIGDQMFGGCNALKYIDFNLNSLESAIGMFGADRRGDTTPSLQYFDIKLPSLTIADSMFEYQQSLKKFTSSLANLWQAQSMFSGCSSLNQFKSQLPRLAYGNSMFYRCISLSSFTCDMPELVSGNSMFSNCNNLESFQGNLSSLLNGTYMFYGCKLNPDSIMYIVHGINDVTEYKKKVDDKDVILIDKPNYYSDRSQHGLTTQDVTYAQNEYVIKTYHTTSTGGGGSIHYATFPATITLGINVTNDQATIANQLQTFAEEAGFDTWQELKQEFTDKGWTATFQYGGTNTDITLSQDEKFRGVPVYARIEEVLPAGETLTEQEKETAEYCTEDGTRYFNIDWGHDVNDYDKFQHFGSLLEACGYFGVIPKKYLQEVTES